MLVSVKSAIGGRAHQVQCCCGWKGPVHLCAEEAITAWNTRTPSPSVADEREACARVAEGWNAAGVPIAAAIRARTDDQPTCNDRLQVPTGYVGDVNELDRLRGLVVVVGVRVACLARDQVWPRGPVTGPIDRRRVVARSSERQQRAGVGACRVPLAQRVVVGLEVGNVPFDSLPFDRGGDACARAKVMFDLRAQRMGREPVLTSRRH